MNYKTSAPVIGVLALLFIANNALASLYQWSAMNGEPNRRIYLWIPEDCKRVRGSCWR